MTENYTPEDPYTIEQMREHVEDPKTMASIVQTGMSAILTLMAGPAHWETLPPMALDLATARECSKVVRGCPETFAGKSWIETQKVIVIVTVKGLFKEFEEWCAANDRGDLLASAVDLMNAALPPEERVTI